MILDFRKAQNSETAVRGYYVDGYFDSLDPEMFEAVFAHLEAQAQSAVRQAQQALLEEFMAMYLAACGEDASGCEHICYATEQWVDRKQRELDV